MHPNLELQKADEVVLIVDVVVVVVVVVDVIGSVDVSLTGVAVNVLYGCNPF